MPSLKIAVCTVHARCLSVLRASVAAYAPQHPLIVAGPTGQRPNVGGTFGEAYNHLLEHIFRHDDELIMANDDIVLTPTSVSLLLADVDALKRAGHKVGFVGARCDFALPPQNIRFPHGDADAIEGLRWRSEGQVKPVDVIAPIFAYLSRSAFEMAKFPPLNWFSDNVICADLSALGYAHFVSRAYVHHVGSQSVGTDADQLIAQARPWLLAHRPALAAHYLGPQDK